MDCGVAAAGSTLLTRMLYFAQSVPAEEILESLARFCRPISGAGH
jgi:hypothetical protein